jgi:HlyD family secretion protein
MKIKKKPLFLGILTLIILGGIWGLYRQFKPLDSLLTLHGNVDIRQVELGFRVGGRIQIMHFEEGDFVEKGALLAELDQVPFQLDLSNQEAQFQQAKANFEKFQKGSRPEEISQAQSLVREREAASTNAELNLHRQEDLVKRGLASKQAFDDASTQTKEAQAQLRSAQEGLALATQGFRIEDIAAAKASLEAAQARLSIANTNLSDTKLLAPEPGTILTRIKEPGAIVAAGIPVYALNLNQPVWVRSYVSEIDLGRIKPGMKVLVYTDTAPDKPLEGQIGYISPQAEFTPKNIETKELRSDLVYRLRVTVNDPTGKLRQGMPVTVTIQTEG